MRRTGFSTEQGRSYLSKRFGKTSRFEFTAMEIEGFLKHLRKLPAIAVAE